MGLDAVLAVLFLFLIYLEVQRGPGGAEPHAAAVAPAAD
jgi:hypothetical protein